MSKATVTYEFPCNEKVRSFLRLEEGIRRTHYFIEQDDPTACLVAFSMLFELIELTGRPDLRKTLVQELQRNRMSIAAGDVPAALRGESVTDLLDELDRVIHSLVVPDPTIKTTQALRDNDWLNLIRARRQMPGGNCCFDLPSLHYWMAKPFEEKHRQFEQWLQGAVVFRDSVTLILKILRGTAESRTCQAVDGTFHLPVDSRNSWSLLQVTLPIESNHIPEISVNRFALWIHFLDASSQMKTTPSRSSFPFELRLCLI